MAPFATVSRMREVKALFVFSDSGFGLKLGLGTATVPDGMRSGIWWVSPFAEMGGLTETS